MAGAAQRDRLSHCDIFQRKTMNDTHLSTMLFLQNQHDFMRLQYEEGVEMRV